MHILKSCFNTYLGWKWLVVLASVPFHAQSTGGIFSSFFYPVASSLLLFPLILSSSAIICSYFITIFVNRVITISVGVIFFGTTALLGVFFWEHHALCRLTFLVSWSWDPTILNSRHQRNKNSLMPALPSSTMSLDLQMLSFLNDWLISYH